MAEERTILARAFEHMTVSDLANAMNLTAQTRPPSSSVPLAVPKVETLPAANPAGGAKFWLLHASRRDITRRETRQRRGRAVHIHVTFSIARGPGIWSWVRALRLSEMCLKHAGACGYRTDQADTHRHCDAAEGTEITALDTRSVFDDQEEFLVDRGGDFRGRKHRGIDCGR